MSPITHNIPVHPEAHSKTECKKRFIVPGIDQNVPSLKCEDTLRFVVEGLTPGPILGVKAIRYITAFGRLKRMNMSEVFPERNRSESLRLLHELLDRNGVVIMYELSNNPWYQNHG